jgi:hypothetical protein
VPSTHRGHGGVEGRQLRLAPDERQLGNVVDPLAARHRPDDGGLDQVLLALDPERLERRGLERGGRGLQHAGRGEHLAGLRLRHHPCGQVDRVAHDARLGAVTFTGAKLTTMQASGDRKFWSR